jgi:hypothetical protein
VRQKIRTILAIAAVAFVIALFVFNSTGKAPEDSSVAWNENMAKGDAESGAHFIMYTDIFCPYCDKFSNALHANARDFNENYIDNGKIYYEMRVTNINYYSGHSDNSTPAGESTYCAARQGKFWEYYEAILDKLYVDYHSKGIGVSKTSEKIPDLELSYYYEAAAAVELHNEEFVKCMEDHEALEELNNATLKSQNQIESGVPYFVFGKFKTSGFNGNWNTDNDYKQAKLLLEAGL